MSLYFICKLPVFQHPRIDSIGESRDRDLPGLKLMSNTKSVTKLPESYTTVPPIQYRKHPQLPREDADESATVQQEPVIATPLLDEKR